MFFKTKYTIWFRKKRMKNASGKKCELSNISIVRVLCGLQEKFDFKILKLELQEWGLLSEIVIQTTAEQKDKILLEFCEEMGDYISDVQMF